MLSKKKQIQRIYTSRGSEIRVYGFLLRAVTRRHDRNQMRRPPSHDLLDKRSPLHGSDRWSDAPFVMGMPVFILKKWVWPSLARLWCSVNHFVTHKMTRSWPAEIHVWLQEPGSSRSYDIFVQSLFWVNSSKFYQKLALCHSMCLGLNCSAHLRTPLCLAVFCPHFRRSDRLTVLPVMSTFSPLTSQVCLVQGGAALSTRFSSTRESGGGSVPTRAPFLLGRGSAVGSKSRGIKSCRARDMGDLHLMFKL